MAQRPLAERALTDLAEPRPGGFGLVAHEARRDLLEDRLGFEQRRQLATRQPEQFRRPQVLGASLQAITALLPIEADIDATLLAQEGDQALDGRR